MEALSILKFWRNAITDDEDDSFFDLAFNTPAIDSGGGGGGGSMKEFQFIESPIASDVLSRNDFILSKPLSPAVTMLRSTPKFNIFMLGFRKSSRTQKSEPTAGTAQASPLNQLSESSKVEQSNRFSVKCDGVESASSSASPALTRDHSLRSRIVKEISDSDALSGVVLREKPVPMYLKLMRPFHVKASKKAKVTDSVTPSSSPVTAPLNLSPRKLSGSYRGRTNLKMVARNLGKSRQTSALGSEIRVATPSYRRRDDSLLEQNDGILGAILHCKRSYTSSSKAESYHHVGISGVGRWVMEDGYCFSLMSATTNHWSEDVGSVYDEAPQAGRESKKRAGENIYWVQKDARMCVCMNEGAYLIFIEGLGGRKENISANIRLCRESDIPLIKDKAGISELYELVVPRVETRAHRSPTGFHMFYVNQIDRGLRFPIPEFISSLCDHLEIAYDIYAQGRAVNPRQRSIDFYMHRDLTQPCHLMTLTESTSDLIHSTNGNHLERPNEGTSIDHQITIQLHAQNITMFSTNETWYFTSQMLVSSSGGPYPLLDGPID
ncbi:putative membrane-associated kinase regulator 2 [Dorcoceras hygrometricum]|uniref:Putative membrane-associated kinase regulator 2 n=1 Tax=Dorcoceras hygrometricum TaxID=472368 RepID=A0A2Z7CNK5_9LAMI|nr:putative membrane-associated kinase regulator 2 [Dorcoceras hygrometricum]